MQLFADYSELELKITIYSFSIPKIFLVNLFFIMWYIKILSEIIIKKIE